MASDLERTVRILDDTRQIIQLLNLYGLIIDSQRYELFEQVFAPDVQADYNPPVFFRNRQELTQTMADFHASLDGSLHRITNHQVLVDGDRASSMSYVVVRLLQGPDYFQMAGYYDDDWSRASEGWRIVRRLFRGSWWEGNPKVGGGLEPYVTTLRHATEADQVRYLQALKTRGAGT
jgi:hypothetical protein